MAPQPSEISRSSSLDKVPQLVGQLNSNGTVKVKADPTYTKSSRTSHPQSLKMALNAVADSRRDSSGSGDSAISDTASEEDYDALQHDPTSVVVGAKGGGFVIEANGTSGATTGLNGDSKKTYEEIVPKPKSRPGAPRLQSIPVTLNKLKEKGRYILTADDGALREILRVGIERERDPASAKKRRSKFSDLVFTRQFTAFDRQNPDSTESIFHGFFTLFWLGTAIFTIRLFGENWRVHGSILGSNEIMEIMFHRDVLVLGLSDGAMCLATGFGWILQRLIYRDLLSWDKQGWIIQAVSHSAPCYRLKG